MIHSFFNGEGRAGVERKLSIRKSGDLPKSTFPIFRRVETVLLALFDTKILAHFAPSPLSSSLAILLIATLIELLWGELPTAVHPVVLIGRVTSRLFLAAPQHSSRSQFLYGAGVALVVPALFALLGAALLLSVSHWPWLKTLLAGVLLSTTFALKGLGAAAMKVHEALRQSDISCARFELRSLCSRDASTLNQNELIAATVESVSENTSDSFVAPLFYFALFGVEAALFYRAVNTLDSMIGYRGRYEYLGKSAARLDDLLNFVPARLTALLLLFSGKLLGLSVKNGWQILLRDRGKTASPNAGYPIATVAGLLGITLEKANHYRLGTGQGALSLTHIHDSWRLAQYSFFLTVISCSAVLGLLHA